MFVVDEDITDPSYFKDYETAYENAERILLNNGCYTLSFEEYMNFFKAITDKYPH